MNTARDAGVEVDLVLVERPTISAGLSAIDEYLEVQGPPDGLMCYNDSLAMGAQSALLRHGVKIPDDTALVGFDGLDFTEFLPVPLTTVQSPISDMCERALGFILNRIEDHCTPLQQTVIRPKLLIRESSMRR